MTDELGADAKSLRQAVNSGSGLIMTAHADSIEEALSQRGYKDGYRQRSDTAYSALCKATG